MHPNAERVQEALRPHAVFRTSPAELVRITGGEVSDLREEE